MSSATRRESLAFVTYAIQRVVRAAGGSDIHAHYIAHAIGFAHRQGKLNQGLGVYEVIDLALTLGVLDMSATPSIVNEGPAWAVVDGHRSSGYYTLNVMADIAIEKARTHGIAIAYGGNHNDAGSFAAYVHKAHEQDMLAITSNNTPPLAAAFGGKDNVLSCPPFDAMIPSGTEPPIWTSVKFAEFYDADVSEAMLNNQPMKGSWLIDPTTGNLSDDAKPYAEPFDGYGRVWGYSCGGQIESPRTYALNLWNEGMTAIANPIGIPVNQLSDIETYLAALEGQLEDGLEATTTVGGSYYLCINPAVFGPIEAVKQKADAFVRSIKQSRDRPGHSVRLPGEAAFVHMRDGADSIQVLANHWNPFFDTIAARYGLTETSLRTDFDAQTHDQ